ELETAVAVAAVEGGLDLGLALDADQVARLEAELGPWRAVEAPLERGKLGSAGDQGPPRQEPAAHPLVLVHHPQREVEEELAPPPVPDVVDVLPGPPGRQRLGGPDDRGGLAAV